MLFHLQSSTKKEKKETRGGNCRDKNFIAVSPEATRILRLSMGRRRGGELEKPCRMAKQLKIRVYVQKKRKKRERETTPTSEMKGIVFSMGAQGAERGGNTGKAFRIPFSFERGKKKKGRGKQDGAYMF